MKTILQFSSNTATGLTSRGGVRSHLFFWTTLILIQKDSCCAYLYFSSCTMQISESTCCCIIHNLNHCTFVLGGRSTVHYCRSHDNSLILYIFVMLVLSLIKLFQLRVCQYQVGFILLFNP